MRLLLVSSNAEFQREINRYIPEIKSIFALTKDDIDQVSQLDDINILILSDDEVSYRDIELYKNVKAENKIYILNDNYNPKLIQTIKTILDANGFGYVNPKRSLKEIVMDVRNRLFDSTEDEGNAISFLGSHRDMGLTSSVLSIADVLSKKIKGEVCVLNLSAFSAGDDHLEYKGLYLDDIYAQVKSNILNPSEIKSFLHKEGQFYYLAGNRKIYRRYHYSTDAVEKLIDYIKGLFSVVLIDAGADPENNLTLQGLIKSDFKIIVTTQQNKGKKFIKQFFDDIFDPWSILSKDECVLLVNECAFSAGIGTDPDKISRDLDIPLLSKIEYVGVHGFNCENDKKLLTSKPSVVKKEMRYEAYMEDIERISETIIKRYNLARVPTKESGNRKGLFSLFKSS